MSDGSIPKGKVFLVGAGPGDPGLFTMRGRHVLAHADVIVYDHLANEVLLSYARSDAKKIYVGKQGGHHSMTQEDINRLLVEKGKSHVVVRLKGGDPFVFGRGGEEAEELRRVGIPFEIIPGVTAAVAVPAYAGIPLSHRDFTASMAFVTGHEREDQEDSKVNWKALAELNGTLVFFMGVKNLPFIVDRLLYYGMSPETPVAVIHQGTTPKQNTVTGSLKDIVHRVHNAGLTPPALIVIGKVVTLREHLNWFETKPLFGKTIVITRSRAQASELRLKLEALGANCIEFPTIEIVDPPSWDPCDQACKHLGRYGWIIFTSVNGVDRFFFRLRYNGFDARSLSSCRIAAIGPATAQRIEKHFLNVDLIPDSYRAEDLAASFSPEDVSRIRILIPRALKARDILPDTLTKMGAHVDVVPVYQTVSTPTDKAEPMVRLLQDSFVDCITFTSSSTVTNFISLLEPWGGAHLLKNVHVASIGPITTNTARSHGIEVTVTATEYTLDGLTRAIIELYHKPS